MGPRNNMECPICYDDMTTKKTFTAGCMHTWCLECHHLKNKYDKVCPLCRKPHADLMEPDFRLTTTEYYLEYHCNGLFFFPRPWRVKRRLRRRMRALRGT